MIVNLKCFAGRYQKASLRGNKDLSGTVERILKWGAENERRRRKSGGIIPHKILKSRVSEIVFTAFSARYFLK